MGNPQGALDSMRHVLSFEPEHAGAHAMLALALLDLHRLHAAELEARRALLEERELPLAHHAMAVVVGPRHPSAEAVGSGAGAGAARDGTDRAREP